MSANPDPNSKTDNLANEDCRPVTCSAWIDFREEKPDAEETVLMWFPGLGGAGEWGPWVKCDKLRNCIVGLPAFWAHVIPPDTKAQAPRRHRHEKLMNEPKDPEAAETVQTTKPEAVDLPRLVRLARQCPRQYPPSVEWGAIPANVELSIALREEGFPFLSKAVLEGNAWARRIASAETLQTLEWSEEEASSPGWTWNSEPNTKARQPEGSAEK